MDIAVRVYNKLKDSPSHANTGKPKGYDIPNYDRILAFDTETRNDERQALTFGSFVIMHNRNPKDIVAKILSLSWVEANKAGISRREYYNLIRDAKKGKLLHLRNKTLRRLGF